jgi:hypothetical protein
MKRALSSASASPPAKRLKSSAGAAAKTLSGANARYVTNGFADPLRNYQGSYTVQKPGPPKARVTVPKPTVKDGRLVKTSLTKAHVAPSRNAQGHLLFADQPSFTPNLTPGEVLQLGSFGGTYFRDIHSAPLQKDLNGKHVFQALPFRDWGLEDGGKVPAVPKI